MDFLKREIGLTNQKDKKRTSKQTIENKSFLNFIYCLEKLYKFIPLLSLPQSFFSMCVFFFFLSLANKTNKLINSLTHTY